MLKNLNAACLVVALITTACKPYAPTAPLPSIDRPAGPPALLSLSGGTATSADHVLLNLRVQDATGRGVPDITVTLSTTAGTLDRPVVVTTIDGSAQAILTTTTSATVTASAAGFTASAHAKSYTSAQPLTVSAAASPFTANKGDGITFTATVTNGTAPFTFTWTFGDGTTGTGATVSHRYFEAGSKSIQVTATEAEGRTGSTSTTVTVRPDPDPPAPPPPPVVPTLSVTLTCTPGDTAPVAVASSCNVTVNYGGTILPGASVTGVAWDWGDGTVIDNASTVPVKAHTYALPGTYTVFATVTATTVDGAKTATTSRSIVVP